MIKNKIFLAVLILLSVSTITLLIMNSENGIDGQTIMQNIDFISGYIKFTKYDADGHIRNQEKIMDIPKSEFSRIENSIKKVSASSITIAKQNADYLNSVSHVFHFQTKSSLIIANYSQESNRLIFRYAAIFKNNENEQVYDPRLIVLTMNDNFREVVESLQGKIIQE